MSHFLLNMFFAIVLLVALQRFSEGTDFFANLVHVQERSARADPETFHCNVCGARCGGYSTPTTHRIMIAARMGAEDSGSWLQRN